MSRRGAQAPPGPPPLLPPPPLLGAMQAQLAALADPAVASGQNAYFKDVIKHRGIKTPALDAACKAFLRELSAATEPTAIRQLGLALLREPLQEDKLAGMNLLAHWLLRCGGAAGWHEELAEVEGVYTAGHVFAWSTCDGICSRLLTPLIKQLLKSTPPEGEACSRAVLSWSQHSNLWLRRTSVVAFVTLAKRPDEQVFSGFRSALLDALADTVRGPERFAQTGTGWVLREVGKADAAGMVQFVEANLACFSREGLRYALEQQPSAVRQRLLDAHKAVLGAVAASTREGAAAAEVAAPHAEAPPTAKRKRRA